MSILNKKIVYTKACAIFTLLCFIVSVCGSNLYAFGTTNDTNTNYEQVFNKTDIVSDQYGTITSVIDSNSDITVVNICDLHCHATTQKNISKILNQLNQKYNLETIFVEGGYGNINVDWLNNIEDKNKVVDILLNKGILTGSEYFKLTYDNDVQLKGLDNEKLHKDNIKRLSWIIKNQEKYKNVIEKVNLEINLLKSTYLNKRNKKFNDLLDKYSSGKIDNKKFYRQLLKYANKINSNPQKYNNITKIKLEQYPNIINTIALTNIGNNINLTRLKQELNITLIELKNKLPSNVYVELVKTTDQFKDISKTIDLLPKLCQQENINLKDRYSSLYKFIQYSNYKSKLNLVELVYEERNLIDQIRKSLSYNNEEYEISYLIDFNKYFNNYLEYKLTQQDWNYFKLGFAKFEQLYNKYATVNRISSIHNDFAEINKYYDINEQRNNVFISNITQGLTPSCINSSIQRNANDILANSKKVLVTVSGGFHSLPLQKMLASKNINVVVVTPTIYGDTQESSYKYNQIINYQSKIDSQALAYTIISCLGELEGQTLLSKIITDLLGSSLEARKILKNIVRDKYIYLYDDVEISQEEKEEVKDILLTTVDKMLEVMPDNWQDLATFSNVNNIFLNMVTKLVEHGFIFSKGRIFNIERLFYNNEDLDGVPAEIYARILPSLQQVLLNKEENVDNVSISTEQLNLLYEDTGASQYVQIYLTDPKDLINKKIREAAIQNKLVVIYSSRYGNDPEFLKNYKLYYKYEDLKRAILKIDFLEIFPELKIKEQNIENVLYRQLHHGVNFFFMEIFKNAFVHGNKGGFEYPIILHVKLDEDNNFKQFNIYDCCIKESPRDDYSIIREVGLSGAHMGVILMQASPLYKYTSNTLYGNTELFKVSCEIKDSSEIDEKSLSKYTEKLDILFLDSVLSIFHSVSAKNKIYKFLDKYAYVWEEIVFRALPLMVCAIFSPILKVSTIALAAFVIAQPLFVWLHKIVGTKKYEVSNNHQLISIETREYPYFSIIEVENNEIVSAEIYGQKVLNKTLIEYYLLKMGVKLKFDNQNKLTYIKTNGTLKLEGFDYSKPQSDVVSYAKFTENELSIMYNDTNTNQTVDVYFDDDIDKTVETIYNAVKNKQLIVCHWFKNDYNINELTDGQLLYLYNELNNKMSFVFEKLSNKFEIPFSEQQATKIYKDLQNCETFNYFFTEIFKNVLSHGFNGLFDSNNIVGLYIEANDDNELVKFKTYNKYKYSKTNSRSDKFMRLVGITGLKVGSKLMDSNPFKRRTSSVLQNSLYVNSVEQYLSNNISFDILVNNYKNVVKKVADKLGIKQPSILKSTINLNLIYLPAIVAAILPIITAGAVPSLAVQLVLLGVSTITAIKWHRYHNNINLKNKLSILKDKHAHTNKKFTKRELKIIYKDTNTNDYIDISLEDSIDVILSKIQRAIDNNKLMMIHFVNSGEYVENFKVFNYLKVSDNIRKLYLSAIFPKIISDSRFYNTRSAYNQIDFFLREILKNAFVHGNKGKLEYPAVFYIDTDENKMFKSFSVYNKDVAGDAPISLLKKAGLTGEHKGIALMEHNPWFNYDAEYIDETKIYKATASLSKDTSAVTDEDIKNALKSQYNIARLSILDKLNLNIDNKLVLILQKLAPVWEELLFRILPTAITLINPVVGIISYCVAQPVFLFAHTITIWLTTKDKAKAINQTKQLIKPTLKLQLPYIPSLILATISPMSLLISLPLSAITAMILHKVHNDQNKNLKLNTINEINKSKQGTNENFTPEELEIMYYTAFVSEYVDIYLDDDKNIVLEAIKQASVDNKLVVLHLFRNPKQTTSLSDEEKLDVYDKIYEMFDKLNLSSMYPETVAIEKAYIKGIPEARDFDFFIRELLKNSFVHGNKGYVEKPIAFYIGLTDDKLIDCFYFFNRYDGKDEEENENLNLLKLAHLTGFGLGSYYMNETPTINTEISLIGDDKSIYATFCSYDKKIMQNRDSLVNFSQKELTTILEQTGADGYEDIYLSDYYTFGGLFDFEYKIKELFLDNKLVILHFVREDVKSDDLDEFTLYDEYDKIHSYLHVNTIADKFETTMQEITTIRDFKNRYVFPGCMSLPYNLNFCFREIISNALVHGNKGKLEVPIALFIKVAENDPELIDSFYVFNKNIKKTNNSRYLYSLMQEIGLTGKHLGVEYMEGDTVVDYNAKYIEQNTLYKVFCDVHYMNSFIIENVNDYKIVRGFKPKTKKIGLLPENIQMVNDKIHKEEGLFKIATSIALKEINASIEPDFVDKHISQKGKLGAKYITKSIRRYMKIIDKLSTSSLSTVLYLSDLFDLIVGTSVIKHIIVDYRYFKSSKLKDAIKVFGSNVSINDNYDLEIDDKMQVIIVDDLEKIRNDYKLVNTGIKINDKSIYRIKASGILVYGANGVDKLEIIKALNTSNELKKKLSKFGPNINLKVDGVALDEGSDVRFEDGLTIIGQDVLLNKSPKYISDYIRSTLEVKNAVSVMYSQKSIIDLTTITDIEKLKQALYNGKVRKIISKEQFEQLALTSQEISSLRQNGIDLYITEKDNKYKELGLSGYIFNVKDTKCLIDYFMDTVVELDEIDNNATINEIEHKLINSTKPVVINLQILEEKFQKENDIINVFSCFDALLGNIKIKTGLGNITNNNVEALGYNLAYDLLPTLPQNIDKVSFKQANVDDFISMLSIQTNSPIYIILQSITSTNLKNKFIEIIKGRILAKEKLQEEGKDFGLKDKKVEILLGKMLLKQIGQKDTTTVNIDNNFVGTQGEIFKKIEIERLKINNNDQEETPIAINTIIEIILVYCQDYKAKQVYNKESDNNITQYRAMLSAA